MKSAAGAGGYQVEKDEGGSENLASPVSRPFHSSNLLGRFFCFFPPLRNKYSAMRFPETRDELSAAGPGAGNSHFPSPSSHPALFLLAGRCLEGNPRDFQGKRRFQERSLIFDKSELSHPHSESVGCLRSPGNPTPEGSSSVCVCEGVLGPTAGERAGRGGESAHRLAEGTV